MNSNKKHKKPTITLRFGASNDDIVVDGVTFVRNDMERKDRRFLRNVLIDSLLVTGAIKRKGRNEHRPA